jgi:hypothetical protein
VEIVDESGQCVTQPLHELQLEVSTRCMAPAGRAQTVTAAAAAVVITAERTCYWPQYCHNSSSSVT